MKASRRLLALAALPALGFAGLARAALNDVFPADFVALPAGKGTAVYYLYDRQQDANWVHGRQVGDLHVGSTIAAARFTRYYDLGGWKVAPVMVLSASDISLSGSSVPAGVDRDGSGWGDLRFGTTAWFIDDHDNRHFLALNLALVVPTGSYDKHEIANAGENRYRSALTLGWIKALGENLTLDLTPELAWYGSNDEGFPGRTKSKQSHTVSLTSYLRYRFSPDWQGFVGGQANEGGAMTVNGVDLDNPIRGRRLFAGGRYAVDKSNAINLRWATDNAVANGLKTSREVALRWVKVF
jgi:hypothetical protein